MNEFGLSDSDIELLRAARSDPDAFGDFYRRHAVAVERWIRAQTPDMATAADLTAETFAQALVSLGRFRGATDESARGWLYGIARNLVRRYHRRGRVELATCRKLGIQLDHDPDELAEIESQIDAAIQTPELTQALNTLPDTQRQALQLRVVDEMDYAQAAALMGTARDLSPAPRRSRRRALRLVAISTTGLAAIATAAVLAFGATTSTPPAFAVTRQHDGSVLVKINRRSGVTGANRKLATMGIHKRLFAVRTSCSGSLCGVDTQSLPQNCLKNQQTGGVVDVIFPSAAAQQRAIVNGTYVPSSYAGNTGGVPQVGPWRVVACPSVYNAKPDSGNTGSGNTGAG